ncbi:MAG: hypothetical protein RLZZ303_2146 [Candidatus Hydrogenedentota bacterium]|jgi:fructokinase
MTHPQLVTLGELLVDFIGHPRAERLADVDSFSPKPGGAPANVAVGAQRLGLPSAFLGMVGRDAFGAMLRETLIREGVETRGLRETSSQPTTLAFVALSEQGVPSFSFVRHPGADLSLRPEDVDASLLRAARVFHFGSLSLCASPAREATGHALEIAREAGCYVTYDPNHRPALWSDDETARRQMLSVVAQVDLIKVSQEELRLLSGEEDLQAGAQKLRGMGPRVVVVTLGGEGMAATEGSAWMELPAEPVEVVDTTGCGDASMAGLIVALLEAMPGLRSGDAIPVDTLRAALAFANRCGAMAATQPGAIPALPRRAEVS